MKILQLRSAFEDSGPGTQALTIGEELRRRGHEVVYAASGGHLFEKIARCGFRTHLIPGLALDKRDPVNSVRTVVALKHLLRAEEVDVVHSHNAAATYLAYFARGPWASRPRLVRSVRGVEVRASHQWRNWLYRTYPATMLAVSAFTREELIKLGADPRRIVVTYNGVDLARFDPLRVSARSVRAEYGLEGNLVVGHVGAFSGWKGQQVLVKALAHIRHDIPPTKIVFVGEGPHRIGVQALAQRLSIADQVVFVGFRTDVERFHAAFDVYAQPSTQGEMLPNSILESMAMGNPWVGSNLSGLGEMAGDGRTGLLAPPGDFEALSVHLRRLLNEPQLRARMGADARRLVEDQFTIERVVDRIEQSYR